MTRSLTVYLSLIFTLIACQKNNVSEVACASQGVADSTQATQTIQLKEQLDFPVLLDPNTERWLITANPSALDLQKLNLSGKRIDSRSLSVSVSHLKDRMQVLKALLDNSEVTSVEPDHMIESMSAEISATAPAQWPHQKIKTTSAWNYTQGRPEVTVAVIDSGVDFTHPDLQSQKWVNSREVKNGRDDDGNGLVDDIHGWDYVGDDGNPIPSANSKSAHHGTHVAGIIGGAENMVKGYSGVSPRIKIMALRFLDNNKRGYTSNAVKAIHYALDHNVKVINLSWGSYNKNSRLMAALARAEREGALIVAASGNFGRNNNSQPFYPASYPYSNIISVTASSPSDSWVKGINYGSRAVDIAAPGMGIVSTDRNGSYRSRGGSSMAAPFVAGVAALLLSERLNLHASQLKGLILDRADRISKLSSRVANGRRVNALASLQSLAQGIVPQAGAEGVDTCL